MLQIVGMLVILIVIGFAVSYIPIDTAIRKLIVGIVILVAVLLLVFWLLGIFGVMNSPRFF